MAELLCIKCEGDAGELQPLFGNPAAQPVAWVHTECLEEHQAANTPDAAAARAAADAEHEVAFARMMEFAEERRRRRP